ncbi:MAG: hypothetical protein ABIR96_01935 [Bdellovibrionota bacterium]
MKLVSTLTLSLACLLNFTLPSAHAQGLGLFSEGPSGGSSSGSSLALPPLSWQKLRYEENVISGLKRDIAIVIPPDQFVVKFEVTLREASVPKADGKKGKVPANSAGEPNILGGDDLMSKLGVDNPTLSPDEVKRKDDLFENIDSISLEVIIDTKVEKAREEILKKILDRVVPVTKNAKPKITVSRLDIVPNVLPPIPKPKPTLGDIVREFKDPAAQIISLVLFALGVFVISFFVIGKVNVLGQAAIAAFKERTLSLQEAANASKVDVGSIEVSDSAHDATTHREDAPEDEAASALISSQHDKELAGIAKFTQLVASNPQSASMFIRQWIKVRPEGSVDALIILTRSIQPEHLVKLFALMSIDERKTLSKILNSPLSKDALGRADLFLNNQIIMDLITPKPQLQPEMQELIMGVTEEEVAAVAQLSPEGAGALMNLLPAVQMIKIAEALPNDLCEQIFPICATLSSADALIKIAEVKTILLEIRGQGEKSASPFIESVPDLMANANLAKERLLYGVLATSQQWSTIDRLAHRQFPAALVEKLPVEVLKEVFLLLPNVKRAELVVSRDDDMRLVLLGSVGEPGKKLRDMLDLEVKELEGNADAKEKIHSHREKIWMDFVKIVRQSLKTDPNFAKATKTVLADWQSSLREGGVKNENPSDNQAA